MVDAHENVNNYYYYKKNWPLTSHSWIKYCPRVKTCRYKKLPVIFETNLYFLSVKPMILRLEMCVESHTNPPPMPSIAVPAKFNMVSHLWEGEVIEQIFENPNFGGHFNHTSN